MLSNLDAWLRSVLWESTLPDAPDMSFEIHRSKGRFVMDNGAVKVLQGVREVFEILDPISGGDADKASNSFDKDRGKLVLIGRGLDERVFSSSLKNILLSKDN